MAQGNEESLGESQDGNEVYSYRADRIEQSAFGVSVWVYTNAKRRPLYLARGGKPWKNYMSAVQSWEISCANKTYYISQQAFFDKDGQTVYSTQAPDGGPRRAIPDSLGDNVITSICTKPGMK